LAHAFLAELRGLCFSVLSYPWRGGVSFAQTADFLSLSVSRDEYEEEGHNVCFEKFDV
jgi:actin-related protein 6